MKSLITFIITLIILGVSFEKSAAQMAGLEEGDSVRVTAYRFSNYAIKGNVLEIYPDAIRISRNTRQYPRELYIPFEHIDKLELKDGVRRNTGRGALIGGGVGGLSLGLIALAAYEPCTPEPGDWFGCAFHFSRSEHFLFGAAAGTLSGAIIGAAVGYTQKRVKWNTVPLEVSVTQLDPASLEKQSVPGIRFAISF